MPLRAGISTVAVYQADPICQGCKIKRYLPSTIFVMGNFLCGVPCRGSHGSAHNGVWSETASEQMSQQIMAASSTRPEECYANYSSPTIYPMQHRHEILRAGTTIDDSEEHTISKKIADTIRYKGEIVFMGMESIQTDETTYVICNGGATSTLSSSFENCTIVHQEKSISTWRKEK
jgi:hypothetical protein